MGKTIYSFLFKGKFKITNEVRFFNYFIFSHSGILLFSNTNILADPRLTSCGVRPNFEMPKTA